MPADDLRIPLRCACGKSYSLKAELAGKTAKCSCGARLKIPAAPALAASVAAKPTTEARPAPAAMPAAPPPPAPPPARPASDAFPRFTASEIDEQIFDAEPMDVSGMLSGGDDFNVRPFDEGELTAAPDAGYELEAPPERKVSDVVRRAVAVGEREAAKPVRRTSAKQSSWALKFVGVYGFIIMGLTALEAITNILGALYLVTRPQVGLEASAVIFVLVAIQTGVAYVIFRLGRGLVDCERSAVHGLVIFYVLHLALAVLMYFADYDEHSNRVAIAIAIVSTFIYTPPIIVGYTNWDEFHAADE
jgi:hypothetical protein